ncbi:MAG: DUF934 domain-containing protein [Pseudomonadales bacterium]
MPEGYQSVLIKDDQVQESDSWIFLDKDATDYPSSGAVVVPLSLWVDQRTALLARGNCAVWLDSEQEPEPLAEDLEQLSMIAINFPVFSDGRAYSYARRLRQLGYQGEVRAIGDVLPDQLHYMTRCGFNAFELRGDKNSEAAFLQKSSITVAYQAAHDQSKPLFARREQ